MSGFLRQHKLRDSASLSGDRRHGHQASTFTPRQNAIRPAISFAASFGSG
jgi:hypothetical protein